MRPEVSSNRFEISVLVKFHLGVYYQRSHDLSLSETHFGANFTSANWTALKF